MTAKTFFTQKIPSAFKIFGRRAWNYIKIAKIELIVLAAVLALDLLTKGIVELTMDYGQQIQIIPNFFSFHFVMNIGAAGGFDWNIDNNNHRRIFFLIFTAVSVAVFFVFMYRFKGKHILSRLSFALIIGGALGNFYDRAFVRVRSGTNAGYFGVRDFIRFDFPFLPWDIVNPFPIFNIADMALVVGVVIFAVYFIIMHKPEPPPLVGPVWVSLENTPEDILSKEDSTIATNAGGEVHE